MYTKKKEGEDNGVILLALDSAVRLDGPSFGQNHGCHLGLLQVREAHEAQAQWVSLTSALGGRPTYRGWAFTLSGTALWWKPPEVSGMLLESLVYDAFQDIASHVSMVEADQPITRDEYLQAYL